MSSSSRAWAQIETSSGNSRVPMPLGLEPLPGHRDEVDDGNRRRERFGRQAGDVVEEGLGRRIENVIAVQRRDALVFGPNRTGGSGYPDDIRLFHSGWIAALGGEVR